MYYRVLVLILVMFFSFGLISKPSHASSDVNVIVLWTDDGRLKAATLMCVKPESERTGVIAVPRYVQVPLGEMYVSVEEYYSLQGRDSLISLLENKFDFTIHSYVSIEQKAVEYTSRILGEILVGEDTTTVVDAFEGTLQEIRRDDQAVVQALARRLFQPDALIRLPYLTYVFMTNIETNFRERDVLTVFWAVRSHGVDTMKKRAVPGEDYFVDGQKVRFVEDEAWELVLQEVTG
ncbi:LCP family protein [Desulfofalx alkaliphila]|uniref:LCP family protein n=1 Tax=Desulfofalx alkaliphila TaxID=105483 RepID=UPI0004E14375|nr:hypothetical protein [Desulfofalx alkaliphila]